MIIRRADNSDISALAALGAATFTQTFGHLYSAEDLAFFVNESHSEVAYGSALANPETPVWVAEDQGNLVAYIKLCPNGLPCDPSVDNAVEISKIYALTEYQNQGLGQELMNQAMIYARNSGFSAMVLSVYSENFGGHKFYRRNGFEKIGEYEFPVGKQLDKEWIMRKKISRPEGG